MATIAPIPAISAAIMVKAGVSGFPVIRISHATMNCVEPPNIEIANA